MREADEAGHWPQRDAVSVGPEDCRALLEASLQQLGNGTRITGQQELLDLKSRIIYIHQLACISWVWQTCVLW